jgi:Kef-type K+ transport system membrane component KefB
MPTLLELSMHFFLSMAVILAVYRLLWPLFKRLGQVQVVAIMVAGFVLGPSLLGAVWPQAQEWLFPATLPVGGTTIQHPSLTIIYVVGQLGLLLYMFLVGSAFNNGIFRQHLRTAGATSAAGILVPMVLGGALGYLMVSQGGYFSDKIEGWQGALFIAAAVAITAFPMLAWIVRDSRLEKTRVGTMALACAASDDACAWILLATVVATSKGSVTGGVIAAGGGLAFLLFMLLVGKRLLARLEPWAQKSLRDDPGSLPIGPLSVVLLVILVSGWFTDWAGIYSVFGAFVAGAVMPRGQFLDMLRDRTEPLVAYLLLPAFFIYSGLNTKLSLIFEPAVLAMAAAVLFVSFAAKFGAVGLASRLQGMSWREAGSMGALANARGLMELILLNIGLSAGLVTPELYTILALMAIITTFMATPLHRVFERSAWKKGLVYSAAGETPESEVVDAKGAGAVPVSTGGRT